MATQKDQVGLVLLEAFLRKVRFQVGQEVVEKPDRQTGDSELARSFLIFICFKTESLAQDDLKLCI